MIDLDCRETGTRSQSETGPMTPGWKIMGGVAIGLMGTLSGAGADASAQSHPDGNWLAYLLVAVLVLGNGILLAILVPLNRRLLSRLARLGTDVGGLIERGDFSKRLDADHPEELAPVAQEVNRLLERLEQSDQALRLSREEIGRRDASRIPAQPEGESPVAEDSVALEPGRHAAELFRHAFCSSPAPLALCAGAEGDFWRPTRAFSP